MRVTRIVLMASLLAGVLIGTPPAEAAPADADETVRLLERLSFDLRSKRLAATERAEITQALGAHQDPKALYQTYVDKWLGHTGYENVLRPLFTGRGFLRFITQPLLNIMLLPLARFPDGQGGWVYFLPGTLPPDHAAGTPACPAGDAVQVTPWWQADRPIKVCAASYHPEHTFDEVGYCGGRSLLGVSEKLREGCGCGPLLLACLPPPEERPDLVPRLNADARAEVFRTILDIIDHDRPWDEIWTTSRSWQSGLIELLYLRRQLIGLLHAQRYTPELEKKMLEQVRSIDARAPAHWVERKGLYASSGLFTTTIAANFAFMNYRDMVRDLFSGFLCRSFTSVHVDSESVLKAIGTNFANIRLLDNQATPMRTQPGCRGCHIPIDNATDFLQVLRTPLYGSFPTGMAAHGKLYIKGESDFRGEGVGDAAFGKLVVAQPEFRQCAVANVFEGIMQRKPLNSERGFIRELEEGFEANGRKLSWLIRTVLTSKVYMGDLDIVAAH